MRLRWSLLPVIAAGLLTMAVGAAPRKPKVVVLGGVRQVPYSRTGDPAGAGPDEKTLKTRALTVDGRITEWTTGEVHEITDRSFVVRRALRINDSLPDDKAKGATGFGSGGHGC